MKQYLLILLSFFAMTPLWAIHKNVADLDSTFLTGSFYETSLMSQTMLDSKDNFSNMEIALIMKYKLMADASLGKNVDETFKQNTLQQLAIYAGKQSTNYALALLQVSDYNAETVQQIEQAKEIIDKANGNECWEYAYALQTLAGAQMMTGNIKKALQTNEQTHALLSKLDMNNHWMMGKCYSLNGVIQTMNKAYEQAIESIYKATDIANANEESEPYLEVYGHAIYVFSSLGLFEQAIETGYIVLDSLKQFELAETPAYTSTLQNIATAHFFNGNKKMSIKMLTEVKNLLERMGMHNNNRYKQAVATLDYVTKNDPPQKQ
ncbi:MAG: hypothetical protein NC209_08410 [Alistipes sp.]|nr:hypothetical protein [Alistipes senegalensis]MCM1251144.1 hypothetical protein [Alistipes sp.]